MVNHEATDRELLERLRPSPQTLVALAVILAAAVALLVVVLALLGGSREDEPSPVSVDVELSYRVAGGDAEPAAEVLRARLPNAGISATVTVPARDRLTISAPAAARADVIALTQPGVLEFYDYERVLVRDPSMGDAEFGARPVTRAVAEERAATVPNGRVVHDQDDGDRWVVFAGSPALTNQHLASVGPGVDERTGEPVVRIQFTQQGRRAYEALTREIAHRGARRGVHPFQFAVLLDGRIIARQPVNHLETPDGVASRVIQIEGGFTWRSARRIAAILSTGPLPAMVRRNEAGGG